MLKLLLDNNVQTTVDNILQWDFSSIEKYMLLNGVYSSQAVVDSMRVEYARFIALSLHYPKQGLPMADEVDPFWHTHMLFSEDYVAFSQGLGVDYLHHRPFVPGKNPVGTRKAAFGRMSEVYTQNFGDMNKSIWTMKSSGNCTCGCGGP